MWSIHEDPDGPTCHPDISRYRLFSSTRCWLSLTVNFTKTSLKNITKPVLKFTAPSWWCQILVLCSIPIWTYDPQPRQLDMRRLGDSEIHIRFFRNRNCSENQRIIRISLSLYVSLLGACKKSLSNLSYRIFFAAVSSLESFSHRNLTAEVHKSLFQYILYSVSQECLTGASRNRVS